MFYDKPLHFPIPLEQHSHSVLTDMAFGYPRYDAYCDCGWVDETTLPTEFNVIVKIILDHVGYDADEHVEEVNNLRRSLVSQLEIPTTNLDDEALVAHITTIVEAQTKWLEEKLLATMIAEHSH